MSIRANFIRVILRFNFYTRLLRALGGKKPQDVSTEKNDMCIAFQPQFERGDNGEFKNNDFDDNDNLKQQYGHIKRKYLYL